MTDNAPLLAVATPQIEFEEGFSGTAYPDPLSPLAKAQSEGEPTEGLSGDPWTVGYGATGPTIVQGTVWTQPEAQAWTQARLTKICGQLDGEIPWWRQMNLERQAVFLSMSYQMGVSGLMGFPSMLACAQAGNYVGASEQMLDSQWAEQTPERADREAEQMKTGVSSYPTEEST